MCFDVSNVIIKILYASMLLSFTAERVVKLQAVVVSKVTYHIARAEDKKISNRTKKVVRCLNTD